jgi:dCTP deaminase
VILSDVDIKRALQEKNLIITPSPNEEHIDSTTVDLRIGEPFYEWDPGLVGQSGVSVNIDIDNFDFQPLAHSYLREIHKNASGKYVIEPRTFYLAPTYEEIQLPRHSKLAARVEGKSSLARLGLVIHMTAPTIHCGYGPGIITLEIYNYGPFPIAVTPGKSLVCQLIVECVTTEPKERHGKFQHQKSPKG